MTTRDEYQDLNMRQTIKKLKAYFKDEWIKRGEEDNAIDGIEFVLNYKWWYALCKMNMVYPYTISYRIIWERKYKTVNPKGFVNEMKTILVH